MTPAAQMNYRIDATARRFICNGGPMLNRPCCNCKSLVEAIEWGKVLVFEREEH